MTLNEFLLARIAEDEAIANEYPHLGTASERWELWATWDRDYNEAAAIAIDPARILAECEAKRLILEPVSGADDAYGWVAKVLALPYADHPDYQPEWRP